MTTNLTADSGLLIMYLVDPGDSQQTDEALEVVDAIAPETVRRTLKKTR